MKYKDFRAPICPWCNEPQIKDTWWCTQGPFDNANPFECHWCSKDYDVITTITYKTKKPVNEKK